MKKVILSLAFIGLSFPSSALAQETKTSVNQEKQVLPKPYNEKEDALIEIKKLIQKAKKENKNIILQAGGNWCVWCLRFNHFVKTTPELNKLVEENYLYYHLNFSPKNKNDKAFAKYGEDGKKLGYPFFIILDKNGNRIHLQESGSFEEGKGYSVEKVKDFFETWAKKKTD